MKIIKVVFTDENGVEHMVEGSGYARFFNPNRIGEPEERLLDLGMKVSE